MNNSPSGQAGIQGTPLAPERLRCQAAFNAPGMPSIAPELCPTTEASP